ncbi:hypothetical protein [Undibacterium griseum]|uniref:Uncharacterized protein n=1 Tax=Undibacterium griseum TaxID=2762295 RepID=A0ABR6YL03_9BURK|nr:hypothetical protein [Undibacterium griseum]MBC3884580.1 hypothetical protein [Undibacterium griseum]
MKIHGLWKISLVRNVLVRTTAGSFNEAGTQACFAETQQKAPVDKPWAGLTNAANWEMSNAAALQSFPKMREWAFQNNCVCLAVVVPSQIRQLIHQRQTGHMPENLVRYFSNMEEACDWLTERGFPFTIADYPHEDFVLSTRQVHNTGKH